MSAADISWVFYDPSFVYSRSVLARSGLARRPVIARRQGIIGRQVESNRLGFALPSDNPGEVSAALTALARDPALRREMGANGARLFAELTFENTSWPIVDAIERVVSGNSVRR